MKPESPNPSLHEVATGFFEPNDRDEAAGIDFGFGATINIIYGGHACGKN
jgi:chitinase